METQPNQIFPFLKPKNDGYIFNSGIAQKKEEMGISKAYSLTTER